MSIGSDMGASRDAIKAAISDVLPQSEVWVSVERGGFLIRVTHPSFAGLDGSEREQLLDPILSAVSVLRLECLTPEEAEWFGPVFREAASTPPVWSSALDGSSTDRHVKFASDLDDDLNPGPVVTFYSLRGGVGRSTALASTARILAAVENKRVLCIDFDLEAPGLTELFGVTDRVREDSGVVRILEEIESEGSNVDILSHILPVGDDGNLFLLPAGRLGADYAESLALVDVESWYREQVNPLHAMIDLIRRSSLAPDVILVDSRTGLSSVAGPLLFDVSDLAVVFFHPQSQAREGTALLTRAMLAATTSRPSETPLTPEPRFVVSPMPAGPSSAALEERARGWVREWLKPLIEARGTAGELLDQDAIHVVRYDSEIAFRDVVEHAADLGPYATIVDWVRQLLPAAAVANIADGEFVAKETVLADLNFEAGTAETQSRLLEDFVITDQVKQAASTAVPLIVGRKGTGKTALFRWLAESPESSSIVVTAANQYERRPTWVFGADAYAEVDRIMRESNTDWRRFWLLYVAAAVYGSRDVHGESIPPLPEELGSLAHGGEVTEVDLLGRIESVLAVPRSALVAAAWLHSASASMLDRHFLLFDGLDTAFGNSMAEKERRADAISALVSLQAEIGSRVPNLAFKIMIRHDIWENLAFENKSHFFGLQLRLKWEDRGDYFKVVLKQALRSSSFASLVSASFPRLSSGIDRWSSEDVYLAWSVLIGERMKGEQTAFTSNWVWNRLADGNGDHSPRSLIQLFSDVLEREKTEYPRNSYTRSIIRPRLLIPSLESVSEAALSAIIDEEFPELRPVADALRSHGRTPVGSRDLKSTSVLDDEIIDLAADAGLVSLRDDGQGERLIRVPDLFRLALGVTRPGPA